MSRKARIVVIGVGNEFRRDDGVGWAVLARLRERAELRHLPSGTVLAICDGEPGRLMALWEETDLAVVVDAAHRHPARPGQVHRVVLDAVQLNLPHLTSSHGFGLGEAVELSRVLARLPGRLVVYAVEAADFSLGTELTPAVSAVVEPLATSVQDDIVRRRDAMARG